MDVEVEKPIFMKCLGHKIYPFNEKQFQDDYFETVCTEGTLVGGKGGIYQILGQHFCRRGFNRMCVKAFLTGEIIDLTVDAFDSLTRRKGPWQLLNEMEVLALVSR